MHAHSGYVEGSRYNGLMIDSNSLQETLKKKIAGNGVDIDI